MIRKQQTAILVLLLVVAQMSYAGGILTNTNQSAQYVRTMSRNASTDIDAVYYNPAGLLQLADGWHIAFYNQTIMQEKKINSTYPTLATTEFIGDVSAPLFPDFYAAYKKDKLAVSFGFGPVAGGGSAEYKNGLPSFEMGISQLPAGLSALGVPTTAYSADINFEGSSIYLGYQLNASYAINDMVSVAVGARYNMAKNTYEGHIKDIMINPTYPPYFDGSMTSAPDFFSALGQTDRAAMTADKEVEAEETGSGITPLIGVNLKLNEKLDVAVKYELNTAIELETSTTKDDVGMFPDGAKRNNDIPALLGLGAQYALTSAMDAALSFTYYFEQSADWEGDEDLLDANTYEIALGLEYDINDALLVSAGADYTKSGVGDDYQTDLGHDLSSWSIGLGLRYKLNDKIDLDLGGLYNKYLEDEVDLTDPTFGPYTETYNRVSKVIVLGIGWHL